MSFPIIAFSVISKQFTKHPGELMKLEYDINIGAATTVYVQIHDWPNPIDLAAGLTAPANGAVPIKSWPVAQGAQNNYKEFKNGELDCKNGVFVVVSTTQATLTIGTGNNKFDSVAGELWSKDLSGTTEVSGQGVVTQSIFSNAVGTAAQHFLLRVSATNLEAGVRYLMLFPVVPNLGDSPIQQWTLNATADPSGFDTKYLSFGLGDEDSSYGLYVRQQTATLVNRQGCFFGLSSTTTTYTAVVGAGMNCYGEYQ